MGHSYETVVVELISPSTFIAPEGTKDRTGRLLLANLTLLEVAIQKTEKTLYVTTSSGVDHFPGVNLLYAKLYDLCLTHGKPLLSCIVMFNFSDNEILKKAKLWVGAGGGVDKSCTINSNPYKSPDAEIYVCKKNLSEILEGENFTLFQNLSAPKKKFSHVVLGGTFDRLHSGHKKLLSVALAVCKKELVIGVTNDKMLQAKKDAHKIESFEERRNNVLNFLRAVDPRVDAKVVEISDPFGPSIVEAKFEAIVASSETLKGARLVNEKRAERGLRALETILVQRSDAYTLSSSFLRKLER